MNLFKSTTPQASPDDQWKSKYLSLTEELDQQKNAATEELAIVRKALVRVLSATKGLDQQLDPHLQKLLNLVKQGAGGAALQQDVEAFSKALLNYNQAAPAAKPLPTVEIIAELFYHCYPDKIDRLQSVFKAKVTQDPQTLIYTFVEALQPKPTSPPIDLGENFVAEEVQQKVIAVSEISQHLAQLLNTVEIPSAFEPQALVLKDRLHASPTAERLRAITTDYIKLFIEINRHLQLEDKEMTVFLSNLTEQLSELGLKASGASQATIASAKKRNMLDQSLTQQMTDLQKSSSDATNLEPLKNLIKSRLASISNEIQEHVKNEELQRQETEKQLSDLTEKLTRLDAETSDLRTKLTAAYNRATKDTLTNLPNRLAYEETILIEIARWQRYKTPLAMAIWDIDFFKAINDNFGHKAGDKTLTIIASILSKQCRRTDFVARLGGEEFIMLLPNTTEQAALVLTDKIRLLIQNTNFNANTQKLNITISCGISEFRPDDSSETVFERADKALYLSKANGRNQCTIAN